MRVGRAWKGPLKAELDARDRNEMSVKELVDELDAQVSDRLLLVPDQIKEGKKESW